MTLTFTEGLSPHFLLLCQLDFLLRLMPERKPNGVKYESVGILKVFILKNSDLRCAYV